MAIKENVNLIKSLPSKGGIFKFFRKVKVKVKRVTWPSKNGIKRALIAAGIVVLIYIVLTGGLDYIFQNLLEFVFKLE